MVQLSHPYMTTGEIIALTRWAFVGKVVYVLICCLGGHGFPSKEQVSFNFIAVVTICSGFGGQKNKVTHCFHCLHIYLPWSDGTRCHDLSFLNVELFHSPQEALSLFFTFCHKGGGICISEVIDISLGNLDSGCDSSSPEFCMIYSAYKLNSRVAMYSLDVLLSQFGTNLLFHIQL